MTENKRFTVHIKWFNYEKTEGEIELFDNGQPLLMSDCVEDVQMVKDLLNELAEENQQLINDCSILVQSNQDYRRENEQLKQSYKEFEDECQSTFNAMNRKQNDLYRKNFKLKEENEQLKQFKEDVFNKIDMHLRMLPTARDNEFNEDDGDPSLYTGAIYMLETLKKELLE